MLISTQLKFPLLQSFRYAGRLSFPQEPRDLLGLPHREQPSQQLGPSAPQAQQTQRLQGCLGGFGAEMSVFWVQDIQLTSFPS